MNNFFVFLYITHFFEYYLLSYYFYIKDKNLIKKNLWEREKIQKKIPNLNNIYKKGLLNSLKNFGVTFIIFYNITPPINNYEYYDLYRIIFYFLYSETHFYVVHRLLHYKLFYKYIHKEHHNNIIVVSINGLDSGIIEHIILNLGSITFPYLLFGGSQFLLFVTVILGIYSNVSSHSGYKNFSELHDYHHQYNKKNYGIHLYLWDRIFNTFMPK